MVTTKHYSGFISSSVSLTGSMESALVKKSPQVARSKTAIMATSSPDPGKTGRKKPPRKTWSQAQSGGCGSWCGWG